MACSCQGKTSTQAQVYIMTKPDGTQKAYTSKIEAMAAAQRSGGSWAPKK